MGYSMGGGVPHAPTWLTCGMSPASRGHGSCHLHKFSHLATLTHTLPTLAELLLALRASDRHVAHLE